MDSVLTIQMKAEPIPTIFLELTPAVSLHPQTVTRCVEDSL
jgi:hypothetical protein